MNDNPTLQEWRPGENELVMRSPRNNSWLWFKAPVEVLSCRSHKEIMPLLQNLNRRTVSEGLYAGGFITYEAAPAFDPAMAAGGIIENACGSLPLCHFVLYSECIEMQELPPCSTELVQVDWQPTVSRDDYEKCLSSIFQKLKNGETYQVNYTFRLKGVLQNDPWDFFRRTAHDMPQAAWLASSEWIIASASPELFFEYDGQELVCRPMKGTAPRAGRPDDDIENGRALANDPKNRAENTMIVDMIRNDLGRIAAPGSVLTENLCTVERYARVWQMTTTVRARTDAGIDRIFEALFPCASITGAPKINTMRIIAELEDSPRDIYCGAIGYLTPQGAARFNVAIRTALIDRTSNKAVFGVGGGIVWDSSSNAEYEECLIKARQLSPPPDFKLLETLRWNRHSGWILLEQHMERLQASADYFDIPFERAAVVHALQTAAGNHSGKHHLRARLTLDRYGRPECTSEELLPLNGQESRSQRHYRLCLAQTPVDPVNVFLYHKTTHRTLYDHAMTEARASGCDDAILYNNNGRITETCIGNLVLALDGRLVTPPEKDGLLNGTYRRRLLERGILQEETVTLDALKRASRVWVINSVRGWIQACVMDSACRQRSVNTNRDQAEGANL